MKRALLWLGPLACLALACLYAYAWFTRDPLLDAFERIKVGMTTEEAVTVMGRSANKVGAEKSIRVDHMAWFNDDYYFGLWFRDGHLIQKRTLRKPETPVDKICHLVSNPSSLWNSASPEASFTMPKSTNPVYAPPASNE